MRNVILPRRRLSRKRKPLRLRSSLAKVAITVAALLKTQTVAVILPQGTLSYGV
jgi:hypothetical protein